MAFDKFGCDQEFFICVVVNESGNCTATASDNAVVTFGCGRIRTSCFGNCVSSVCGNTSEHGVLSVGKDNDSLHVEGSGRGGRSVCIVNSVAVSTGCAKLNIELICCIAVKKWELLTS